MAAAQRPAVCMIRACDGCFMRLWLPWRAAASCTHTPRTAHRRHGDPADIRYMEIVLDLDVGPPIATSHPTRRLLSTNQPCMHISDISSAQLLISDRLGQHIRPPGCLAIRPGRSHAAAPSQQTHQRHMHIAAPYRPLQRALCNPTRTAPRTPASYPDRRAHV